MMIREEVKKSIKSIRDVILTVSKNPLLYFSECGLQAILVNRLLECSELSNPIETGIYDRYKHKIDKLSNDMEYLDNALSVPPLQREYGSGNGGRTDIVILNPEDIESIDNFQFQSDEEYLSPLIAIEIGTEKSDSKYYCKHLEKDVEDINDLDADFKYILDIIRNKNKCKKGTDTYKNKEETLKPFKESFTDLSKKYEDIFFIGMIHHIAYQEVEFFSSEKDWKKYEPLSNEFERVVSKRLNL
ncbi:MAG: hypothetical protein ABEK17_03460 [Candidatus Aenigmatarchaeota archaeon]